MNKTYAEALDDVLVELDVFDIYQYQFGNNLSEEAKQLKVEHYKKMKGKLIERYSIKERELMMMFIELQEEYKMAFYDFENATHRISFKGKDFLIEYNNRGFFKKRRNAKWKHWANVVNVSVAIIGIIVGIAVGVHQITKDTNTPNLESTQQCK